MNRIGHTDLDVFPLCLGGNIFGWTADEPTSFAILDAYNGAGTAGWVAVPGSFRDVGRGDPTAPAQVG